MSFRFPPLIPHRNKTINYICMQFAPQIGWICGESSGEGGEGEDGVSFPSQHFLGTIHIFPKRGRGAERPFRESPRIAFPQGEVSWRNSTKSVTMRCSSFSQQWCKEFLKWLTSRWKECKQRGREREPATQPVKQFRFRTAAVKIIRQDKTRNRLGQGIQKLSYW